MQRLALTLWLTLTGILTVGNLGMNLADLKKPGEIDGPGNLNPVTPTNQNSVIPTTPDPVTPIPRILTGDVLVVVLHTPYFDKNFKSIWNDELAKVRKHPDLKGRLLGGAVYVIDLQRGFWWEPGTSLPDSNFIIPDNGFEQAYGRALEEIDKLRKQAQDQNFKTFLIWNSDRNPDSAPRNEKWIPTPHWVKLLWQGLAQSDSKRFTELLGKHAVVPFGREFPSNLADLLLDELLSEPVKK